MELTGAQSDTYEYVLSLLSLWHDLPHTRSRTMTNDRPKSEATSYKYIFSRLNRITDSFEYEIEPDMRDITHKIYQLTIMILHSPYDNIFELGKEVRELLRIVNKIN